MDSEENTQEVVNDNRAQAGTTADAGIKSLVCGTQKSKPQAR